MSLRQKSIEVLFADFVEKYFAHFGYKLPSKFAPTDLGWLMASVPLYENTLAVVDELFKRKETTPSRFTEIDQNLKEICELVRLYYKIPHLYLFSIDPDQLTVDMTFGFPSKTANPMMVNSHLLKKLDKNQNKEKFVEAIKDYFHIPRSDLNYDFFSDQRGMRFLLYQGDEVNKKTYSRLFGFIFNHRHYTPQVTSDAQKSNPGNRSASFAQSAFSVTASKSSQGGIFRGKNDTHRRLVAALPVLMGESAKELQQGAKLLLQLAGLSQVAVVDTAMTKVIGFGGDDKMAKKYTADPKELVIWFEKKEKENRARKFKTKSGKNLLLFTSKTLPPNKKSPDFPFNGYPECLEKIIIRVSQFSKR